MTQETTTRRRRWVMPLLFLSLAANLLIVGIVAGTFMTSGGDRPDRASREVGSLVGPHFFRALEPSDRRALIRDAVGQRDRVRENRREQRARVEQLLGLLRAETMDTQAVQTLLEQQRALVASRHRFGEELLLSRLTEMSLEERQNFADRLASTLRPSKRN